MTSKKRLYIKDSVPLFFFIGISLATGIIYSNGLNGIFLLDDIFNIRPAIINSLTWENLYNATLSNSSGTLKRPVSAFSFAITSILHGSYSWGFKYHNLLIHISLGFLIFLFSRKIFNIEDNKPESNRRNNILALIASSIWLLHPLHVSTVLYSVQRMTQLSAVFTVLALTVFLYSRSSTNNNRKLIGYILLFPLFFLLALFSKENAILIVIFLLVLSLWFSKKGSKTASYTDKIFLLFFSIIPVLLGPIALFLKREEILDYTIRSFTLYERVLSQINFIWLYLQQLFLPRLSKMGLYFDDVPIPETLSTMLLLKLLAIIILISVSAYKTIFKGSLIGMGVLFFFSGHALESTIIPLELAFEHRNYLPSIGIFIVITCSINKLHGTTKILGFSATLLCLAALLLVRVDFWSNAREWQKTTLAFHPKSERTQINYLFDLAKYSPPAVFKKHLLETIEAIPDKISLKFFYLEHTCKHTHEHTENAAIIDDIYEHINTQNLTVIGFNSLAALSHKITNKKCSSIGPIQVENIINTALSKAREKNRTTEQLHFLQGLLALTRNNPSAASKAFNDAYSIFKNPRYKLAEVKALLTSETTRLSGIKLLNEIEDNNIFDNISKKEILKIRSAIKTNNFKFEY